MNKLFFGPGDQGVETSHPSQVDTKTSLAKDLKLDSSYENDLQNLNKQGKLDQLKKILADHKDIFTIDQNGKLNINFDGNQLFFNKIDLNAFQDFVNEINDNDKTKELEIVLSNSFGQNNFDQIIKILKIDSKNKANVLVLIKNLNDGIKNTINDKIKNINDTTAKNNLIWTLTLYFASNLNFKTQPKTSPTSTTPATTPNSQDPSVDASSMYTPLLDKISSDKNIDLDGIMYTNPMLAASKLEGFGKITNGKLPLSDEQYNILSKKNSDPLKNNEEFSQLLTKYKSALEQNSPSMIKQIHDVMESAKNLMKPAVQNLINNGDFRQILQEFPDADKLLKNLSDNALLKYLFQFLGLGSLIEQVESKQEGEVSRDFLKVFQSLDDTKIKDLKFLGDFKQSDLKKADFEKINNSDKLLSTTSVEFLKTKGLKTEDETQTNTFLTEIFTKNNLLANDKNKTTFLDFADKLDTKLSTQKSTDGKLLDWEIFEKTSDGKIIFKTSNLDSMLSAFKIFEDWATTDPHKGASLQDWLTEEEKNNLLKSLFNPTPTPAPAVDATQGTGAADGKTNPTDSNNTPSSPKTTTTQATASSAAGKTTSSATHVQ